MKRNTYGVNFDLGVPLESDFDFNKLYIPSNQDHLEQLILWLKNGQTSIQVAGQIGIGKSTFIQKAFKDSTTQADIQLHFDKEGQNLSTGDFLRIVLLEIVKSALNNEIDLSFSKLPSEISQGKVKKWNTLFEKLTQKEFSFSAFNLRNQITENFDKNKEFVIITLNKIVEHIEDKIKRKLIFFASGIDKFETYSFGYFSLFPIIDFLIKYKSLFEINAAHIFDIKWPLRNTEKIILRPFNNAEIQDLLNKRLGAYSFSLKDISNNLIKLSGGNPRQALRLLLNYEHFFKIDNNSDKALFDSTKKTIQDFFSLSEHPSDDLMNLVKKENSLSSTTFSLPGDKETAQRALFGNWIIMKDALNSNKWKVEINPLISSLYFNIKFPAEFENQLIKTYSDEQQVSPIGLTFSGSIENIIYELNKSFTKAYTFNTIQLLDIIASSLLSKDRTDRIIIAYKENNIVDAVRHYIFAKANTFEYQSYKHFEITKGILSPSNHIRHILQSEKFDIYSFDFSCDLEKNQLQEIERMRDYFIYFQMLWWIPLEKAVIYFPSWKQLRQLFQIIILEDELLNSLNEKDIEDDITFLKKLSIEKKSNESLLLDNLKIVLTSLKKMKRGRNG
jgi:NADH/NAD ratio-sensing transcriptional regulator Rex